MGVLIKGMEMPKNCAECRLHCDAGCVVTNYFLEDDYYEKRAPWCPLIEYPLLITSIPQLNISSPISDPEWQKAHKEMGFWTPLADLYEALGIIGADEGKA